MKYRLLPICFSIFFLTFFSARAQSQDWPKSLKTSEGTDIKMYEPQPESYTGNLMKIRAAISTFPEGKSDPIFGVIWADISLTNSGNNSVTWENVRVTNIKLPGASDQSELDRLSTALETEIPALHIRSSPDVIRAKLNENEKETKLSDNLSTAPPKIIYSKKPSMLVVIDGQPQLKTNSSWGVEQVVNTPFTLVKSGSQQYFLYGGKKWYSASSVYGPWNYVSDVPSSLRKMDADVRANDTSAASSNDNLIADIMVSTEPAELIQSNGEANFSPIQGTNLLYMTNSANDIFMDVNSQKYYVLLSGRWYQAPNLNSPWTYISSQDIPDDFAKIPEGSSKDGVLSSVAGTDAAKESVLEAQVPQTAKVDRKNASATVTYDGEPQFENIQGTDLRYAVNTPGSVLNEGRKYFYVENGVWFESASANGPWYVATQRPAQVDYIPASYPVYNVKYVYIYDATPDYVYMGYTPGYLGNYIYGPTIVYGTGYYYKPWRGRYYYPRSTTWGFNMRYDPWTGWGFGVNLWAGWLSINVGSYNHGPLWGGWWGPPVYRPLYCRPYTHYYGYNARGNNYTVYNRTSNVYRYRRDVVTNDRLRSYDPRYSRANGVDRPSRNYSGRPSTGYDSRPGNRNTDQRADGNFGNRPANRNYEPTRQPRNGDYNNNNNNNNNSSSRNDNPARDRNGSAGPVQRDANPRVYSPDNNRYNRNNNNNSGERPNTERTNRPANPVVGTPNPQRERTIRDQNERTPQQPRIFQGQGDNGSQRQRPIQSQSERTQQQPRSYQGQGESAPQRQPPAQNQTERAPQSQGGVSRPERQSSEGGSRGRGNRETRDERRG